MNSMKTTLLLGLLTGLLLVVGYFLGGQQGMFLALIFSAIMNFVSYFFSDKLALAAYRAQPVTEAEAPKLSRDRPAARFEGRDPDAAALRRPEPRAERLRHGPKPSARRGRGDDRESSRP